MSYDAEKLSADAWKVIGVVILGPFMTQLDSTIVNVSLPAIKDSLFSSVSLSQWIITGYLLALALMLPLNAWLVDRLGAKKLYLLCFFFFTAASGLCAMAATMPELIAARVVQGIAGGLLAPLTQLMMARVSGRQMARVAGYAAVPILFAPLVGPLLAGAILQHFGWPWLFYVNLPVGAVAIALAVWWLPHDEPGTQRFFGTLPFVWMATHEFSTPLATLGLVVRGLGQGATGLPSIAAAYAAVPKAKLGLATMTVNIIQRLGGPIVTTLIAISVSFSVGVSMVSGEAFLLPFVALTLVQLLVIGAAVRLPVRIYSEATT